MTDQFRQFIKVLKAFNVHGVDYILLQGMGRLTRDIDIFVKMAPDNINKLRSALYAVFNDNSIEKITLEELNKYPVIRYGTPYGFYIDIMARLGETAAYDDLEFKIVEYQGVRIRVATPETLYKLKKDTLRDKDKIDPEFLKELIRAREKESSPENHFD